ncbi:MAG TPA: sigma-54-dependent Fis family transcriptional regulator, partial [Phaeodactylibacter sp.]|nr:sigma-54-dependent Fis family transcriptional regulator [Phaeodactylibacter sp.]
CQVAIAETSLKALEFTRRESYDLVILDMEMPKTSGLKLLKKIKADSPSTSVVMTTSVKDTDSIVQSMLSGASYVLAKPLALNEVLKTIKDITQTIKHPTTTAGKNAKVLKKNTPLMIGNSQKLKDLQKKIKQLEEVDSRVLIQGPNGSGKELVARSLHATGSRAKGPFVAVNCAAIPADLIDSILFGNVPGAFTGAANKIVKGKFEQAQSGTLFLDEVGDMPLAVQAKVLRVLEDKTIIRVGDHKEIPVDCRIIAATNRDLQAMMVEGTFREDLYYRLAVIDLHVPALNDRREDIPSLVNHFMELFCRETKLPLKEISNEAMNCFKTFDYKGNIRQLRNLVEKLYVMCDNMVITKKDFQRILCSV